MCGCGRLHVGGGVTGLKEPALSRRTQRGETKSERTEGQIRLVEHPPSHTHNPHLQCCGKVL